MPYTVLSLDLGSNMGWCLVKDGVIEGSGIENHKLYTDEAPGCKWERFEVWLINFFNHHHVDEIFYEDVPRFMSNASARTWCGYLCILQKLSHVLGIRLHSVKSGEWKKMLLGGELHKKMLARAAEERKSAKAQNRTPRPIHKIVLCEAVHAYGWKGGLRGTEKDNDEADAIGLAIALFRQRRVDLVWYYHITPKVVDNDIILD